MRNKKKIALYTAGATLATTSASDAALVFFTPTPGDATLLGNAGSFAVDQGQITFNPALSSINYTRALAGGGGNKDGSYSDNTANQLNLNPLRSSGKSTTPSSSNGNDDYSVGAPVGSGTLIDGTTLFAENGVIGNASNPFIPVLFNNGQDFFGWVQATTDGTNITVNQIAFETTPNTAVITPTAVVPESSTVMAMLGGTLAGGLIGIRAWRKRKQHSKQSA